MDIEVFLVLCLFPQQLRGHLVKLPVLYAPGTLTAPLQRTVYRRLLVLYHIHGFIQVYLRNLLLRLLFPFFLVLALSLHLLRHEHGLFWVGFGLLVHI